MLHGVKKPRTVKEIHFFKSNLLKVSNEHNLQLFSQNLQLQQPANFFQKCKNLGKKRKVKGHQFFQ